MVCTKNLLTHCIFGLCSHWPTPDITVVISYNILDDLPESSLLISDLSDWCTIMFHLSNIELNEL